MHLRRPALAIVAGCALAGGWLKAEEPRAAHTDRASADGPAGSAPAPPRTGMMSDHLAAALREKLPGYSPAAAVDEAPPPDGVIVLPKMIVREPKVRAPEARDWLSKRGLADELWKKHPGASLRKMDAVERPIPNYSALMDHEDRRRQRLQGLEELADTIGSAAGEQRVRSLRREIERASFRRLDSLTDAMDRAANNGRR